MKFEKSIYSIHTDIHTFIYSRLFECSTIGRAINKEAEDDKIFSEVSIGEQISFIFHNWIINVNVSKLNIYLHI